MIDNLAHIAPSLDARQSGVVPQGVRAQVGGRRRETSAERSQPLQGGAIAVGFLRQTNGQHPDKRLPHKVEAIVDYDPPFGGPIRPGPVLGIVKVAIGTELGGNSRVDID